MNERIDASDAVAVGSWWSSLSSARKPLLGRVIAVEDNAITIDNGFGPNTFGIHHFLQMHTPEPNHRPVIEPPPEVM